MGRPGEISQGKRGGGGDTNPRVSKSRRRVVRVREHFRRGPKKLRKERELKKDLSAGLRLVGNNSQEFVSHENFILFPVLGPQPYRIREKWPCIWGMARVADKLRPLIITEGVWMQIAPV